MTDYEEDVKVWAERQALLSQIKQMKILSAFIGCSPMTLQYCHDVLKISDPLPIVEALKALGCQISFDNSTSTLTLNKTNHALSESAITPLEIRGS